MKRWRYYGWRNPKDDFNVAIMVEMRGEDGTDRGCPLKHIVRHSPTGMEWGYMGSGPSDLALSILVDFFIRLKEIAGKKTVTEREAIEHADRYYWRFKDRFISCADRRGFSITDTDIRDLIKSVVNEQLADRSNVV